MFGTEI